MAILQTGNFYNIGDQVTSTNLNAAVNDATFHPDAVDDSTIQLSASGQIMVRDKGITAAQLEAAENNQLFIGNGTGFTKKLLSAGNGITLTVDDDSIDISSTGSIGGTSGSTDNAIIRANGDLGSTIQPSAVLINDDNDISGARDISGTRNVTVGNLINVTSANGYQVNGTKVLGAQGGTITSIETPTPGPGYDKTLSELTAFVYSMNNKTNEILVALRAHGIIAT
jgi:hypothetical protein